MGLPGVDNGRIWFDNKRIPRENLLNKHADVTEDGKYVSPISNKIQRFATMMAPLVYGRLKISSSASLVALTGLKIAIRYSNTRTQFKGEDGKEMPIITYLTQKRRLYPYLASTLAYHLNLAFVKTRYERYITGASKSAEENKELHIVAAGAKGKFYSSNGAGSDNFMQRWSRGTRELHFKIAVNVAAVRVTARTTVLHP
jgi:acyl-CoA oxidase